MPHRKISPFVVFISMVCGCQQAQLYVKNVATQYKFDNVRKVGDLDEWEQILALLKSHAQGRDVQIQRANFKTVGDIQIYDYTAEMVVDRLTTIDEIHTDLDALAKKRFGKEKIEFKLLRASTALDYRSNYVTAEIEITLSGITDPRAVLTIYLHSGEKQDVAVSNLGSWSVRIKVAPNRRFIYGYSTDTVTQVQKFFRIDIFSQQQEAVGADEFERLRREAP